jgi:hypothetical protein
MAKELVWLEDTHFAAWGCEACAWIMLGRGVVSSKPGSTIREAFDKHECANFPLALPARKAPAKTPSPITIPD